MVISTYPQTVKSKNMDKQNKNRLIDTEKFWELPDIWWVGENVWIGEGIKKYKVVLREQS